MTTSRSLVHGVGAVFFVMFGLWTPAFGAPPGSHDASFDAAVTLGEVGFSLVAQPDGKVIAVGTFGVMRFLGDGAVDPTFQPIPRGPAPYSGAGRGVGSVVLQPDGRVLIAGTFTNADGAPLPGIFRLKTDGSIDSSFSLDPLVQTSGRVLALQPDGKVLTDGLVRLRSDGSLDPDFVTSWYTSPADFHALALTPEGKVYFATSEGIGRVNPDGSSDESFAPEPGLGPWGALALQRDGKLIVGQYSDGPGFKSVRRLLPNGTDDPAWTVPDVNGGDAVVYSILVQPDGKVLVGGSNLESFNGVGNANLGRLNPDGTVDPTFDTGADLHYYSVEDMALAPDGRVMVAGTQFSRPDIALEPGIWRLHNNPGMQPHLDITVTKERNILLVLRGQLGATYRLEYRGQLSGAASWIPLANVTLSGAFATLKDTGWTSSAARYYRAVSVP